MVFALGIDSFSTLSGHLRLLRVPRSFQIAIQLSRFCLDLVEITEYLVGTPVESQKMRIPIVMYRYLVPNPNSTTKKQTRLENYCC